MTDNTTQINSRRTMPSNVVLHTQDGQYRFCLQSDVTPHESAQLSFFFLVCSTAGTSGLSIYDFLTPDAQRHLEPVSSTFVARSRSHGET